MDIYIKSFNRPYLLDRTLASIYHFLHGFNGNVIVLDDGTPEKYLQKILIKYPLVIIKKSPFYIKKSQSILNNSIPEKVIPANFWRDVALKGSEHFILLEDDMWFTQPINYIELINEVNGHKVDIIKLLWLGNDKLISNNIINKTSLFNIVKPKVLTKNSFLFDAIFRTNKWKLGSIVIKLMNHKKELLKYYQLYAVAGAIYSKRYYANCWKNHQEKVDELQQISNLLKSEVAFNIANFQSEVLKTTCKTTASLISKDHIDKSIDIFKINKILNEAWFNNDSYDEKDFKHNIPTHWIKKSILKHADEQLFDNWQKWYNAFVNSYKSIDCNIE